VGSTSLYIFVFGHFQENIAQMDFAAFVLFLLFSEFDSNVLAPLMVHLVPKPI